MSFTTPDRARLVACGWCVGDDIAVSAMHGALLHISPQGNWIARREGNVIGASWECTPIEAALAARPCRL